MRLLGVLIILLLESQPSFGISRSEKLRLTNENVRLRVLQSKTLFELSENLPLNKKQRKEVQAYLIRNRFKNFSVPKIKIEKGKLVIGNHSRIELNLEQSHKEVVFVNGSRVKVKDKNYSQLVEEIQKIVEKDFFVSTLEELLFPRANAFVWFIPVALTAATVAIPVYTLAICGDGLCHLKERMKQYITDKHSPIRSLQCTPEGLLKSVSYYMPSLDHHVHYESLEFQHRKGKVSKISRSRYYGAAGHSGTETRVCDHFVDKGRINKTDYSLNYSSREVAKLLCDKPPKGKHYTRLKLYRGMEDRHLHPVLDFKVCCKYKSCSLTAQKMISKNNRKFFKKQSEAVQQSIK